MFQLITLVIIIISSSNGIFLLTSAGSSYNCVPKPPSSCANGLQINYPFWIDDGANTSGMYCHGYRPFQISCARDGRPVMNISSNLYYIQNLDLDSQKLTVLDVDIDRQACPRPQQNFSIASARFLQYDSEDLNMTIFYNCSTFPQTAVQHLPCLESYNRNNNSERSFAFMQEQIPEELNSHGNCKESVVVPVSVPYGLFYTNANYTQALKRGFQLTWSWPVDCEDCVDSGGQCWENKTTSSFRCNCPNGKALVDQICSSDHVTVSGLSPGLKITTGVSTGVGVLLLVLLFIYRRAFYKLWNLIISKLRKAADEEMFLESYGGLSLQRYKYTDVKKMTNLFKETLGQGGYGTVFKGKLRDGRLVAVKILNVSKGNGEEFINEVTTIGRTNHVNVVSLLGFCIEGTKRALVYEFMPNGSLERFIYNSKESTTTLGPPLGKEKLYQIALDIARGLDYLHRGCNTRILHFDIKPHNILLDQNFRPKISDFGLAKLCPAQESIMSMVGARGTVGYIAPELCFTNFGGVSHKSDVYSYGMMVLEMIGGRKNSDLKVTNDSEIYFPDWIYNHVKEENDAEAPKDVKVMGSREVFDDELSKKMILVALWCIQAHPTDRPSISKVVEMLEGSIDELQIPPNPDIDPRSRSSIIEMESIQAPSHLTGT